ncbi:MAG: tetratricopeptide repeat protein [Marinicella sp.]|nr:tetratricopeptide repeat protein [Xanthomonadales bacterium]
MSQIERAKELHNQGKYQQAIEGYQSILKDDPNNDEAHFGIAHANSRINHLTLALDHAKRAVNLAPNSDRYLQFLGQMYLGNQQVDEALKTFKRSIKENPNLFFSYLAIGDIYALKNESTKAKENYKLALKVDNNGIPAIIKLSRLLLLEGDYQAAADELQTAELQFPQDPRIKLQMGILKLEQQQDGFAELYFKKLIEDDPRHVLAETYYGISLIKSDNQKANNIITRLTNNKVQIPELMVALGMLHARKRQYRDAIQYLTPVCQTGLAYPSWLLVLAEVYVANQQPNTAVAVLNEILKRGDNPKALLMLGEIYMVNHNYPLALKTFKRIKESADEFAAAQLRQAECLFKSKDYDAAIKLVDKLLANKPDHNASIKLKLNALSQLNRLDDALALIRSIDPDKQMADFNQLMHFYAGLLLDAKQEYEQAWTHFSTLKHAEPKNIPMLSAAEEKAVQKFSSQAGTPVFRFVMTAPATGHHDFIQWLLDNNITPLLDRFTANRRADVFTQHWTVDMLQEMTDAQAHLWRKKYTKQLKQVLIDDAEVMIDFLPFSPLNVAIIKKVFPQAQVLILSRNFADLRLHNRVFGSQQIHYSQMSKLTNQMITLNSKLKVVDIDAWQNQEPQPMQDIHDIFGMHVNDFKLVEGSALDRVIFPYMHWKNYQQQLNQ